MSYSRHAIPAAFSMMRFIDSHDRRNLHPLIAFSCCWMAFNNIYVKHAEAVGLPGGVARLDEDPPGTVLTRPVAHVQMARIIRPNETVQIVRSIDDLAAAAKDHMLSHEAVERFVQREPRLHGFEPPADPLGQNINGVLNVGYTAATGRSIWSPLDPTLHERYRNGVSTPDERRDLARQVGMVLYTIRNNTFHGGKEEDDANDERVLGWGYQLLRIIVTAYMRD